MTIKRQTYTCQDDRSGIWEGTFREVQEMNIGDYMLVHHTCKHCEQPLIVKIKGKQLACTFISDGEERKIYDYITKSGSAYKSSWKLVSTYDQRVGNCKCEL